jgi:FkbM family methyltransferase
VARSLTHRVTDLLVSAPVAATISATTGGRIRSHGIRVDLSHAAVDNRTRAAVFWRLYERAEIELIHRHLPPDVDVIELGSCLGVTGAHILAMLDASHRLVAVEANPALIDPLRVALCDERATVVHGAIAYGSTSVDFYVHPGHLRSKLTPSQKKRRVVVPAVSLSGVRAAHGVLGSYALVADIEGAEAQVLANDADALRDCRLIIAELHDTDAGGTVITREQLAEGLRAVGFRQIDERRRTAVFMR